MSLPKGPSASGFGDFVAMIGQPAVEDRSFKEAANIAKIEEELEQVKSDL